MDSVITEMTDIEKTKATVERSSLPVKIAARNANDWFKWLPPVLLIGLAVLFQKRVTSWTFMWILAGALFFAAKWITLTPYLFSIQSRPFLRVFSYFALWPGMNAPAFLAQKKVCRPRAMEWLYAIANTFLGTALLALALRLQIPGLAAWLG